MIQALIDVLQNYVSVTLAFLTAEMFMIYNYYRYLNNNGGRGWANMLLVIGWS